MLDYHKAFLQGGIHHRIGQQANSGWIGTHGHASNWKHQGFLWSSQQGEQIIRDAYKGYTLTPPNPVPDANGNITQADHIAHNAALIENVVEFYLLNQFRAALPVDLRRVINLQPMHTLDLDTAVHLDTIELHSKDEARGTTQIQAVQQEEEEDGVEAVTKNRQKKFFPQNQQNRGQQNVRISGHRTTTEIIKINSNGGTTIQATTPTGTRWHAFSAGSKATDKRNAGRGSILTSHVWTSVANLSGRKSAQLTMVLRSRPSWTRIFSTEFDGTPTLSSHNHSSAYYEFVCCFNSDL